MHYIVTEISPECWQNQLVGSPYATPFHHACFMQQTVALLGGTLKLYQCTAQDATTSMLIPIYQGGPWSCSGFFSTAAIGSGGPIPTARLDPATSPADTLSEVLNALAGYLQQKIQRCLLSPLLSAFIGRTHRWTSAGTTALVSLHTDTDTLFQHTLTSNARTAVRKSERNGIRVSKVTTAHDIDQACALIVHTQHTVGARYRTPPAFLHALHAICGDLCHIYIAQKGTQLLSAAVVLRHYSTSCHWLHGWNRDHAHLCANQGLLWYMIHSSAIAGARIMDLGLSHTPALLAAKQRWGAIPTPVFTYTPPNDR